MTFPALPRSSVLPSLLFAASAAFVVWRNSYTGVLWDLSYILNTAARIAEGDVPYAQFPLTHAPLTFLFQALLVKLLGPHYPVQVAYAALAGGLATVLTYAIVRRVLRDYSERPEVVALAFCAPLVPLGIYAIYPHPHYDPDACLWSLVALCAVLAARDRPSPRRWVLAGALVVVPLFAKQNIGAAFLAVTFAGLVLEATVRPTSRGGLLWCAAGSLVVLAAVALAVQLVAGVPQYLHWTVEFAGFRAAGADRNLRWMIHPGILAAAALLAGGLLASRRLREPWDRALVGAVVSAPFVGAALLTTSYPAAPLALWPVLLDAALVIVAARVSLARRDFIAFLPFVCVVTALASLLAQGLSGSTYGIWPLLAIALASCVPALRLPGSPRRASRLTMAVVAIASLSMTVAGLRYTVSDHRNTFIHRDGELATSATPALAGLAARGPYIPELDQILTWIVDHVPQDDAMLVLPGEDPVYFALARQPRFPVVLFDPTGNPYTADEIARAARAAGVRWLLVKERLQLVRPPVGYQELEGVLTGGLRPSTTVGAYRVYRLP